MTEKETTPEGEACSIWGREWSRTMPEAVVKRAVKKGTLSEGCLPTEETEPRTVEEVEEHISELQKRLERLQEKKAAEEVAEGEAA